MLRWLVTSCGGMALFAGTVLICSLDIPAWLRMLAVSGWLLVSVRELRCQTRAYARISRLRIDSAGALLGTTKDGEPQVLRLQSGSMVLSKVAWLILRFADGSTYGELLRERSSGEAGWRGLKVLSDSRRGDFGGNQ
jgi:hypothetical protein